VGLLVSFLLVFGLDRLLETPGWARLAILLGGTSLFAVFAPFWLHRWVWRHRRETQLARLIARRFPGLGDRLLGVIELQDQHESVDSLSPRLRVAAMEAVAAEAGRRSLDEALPPPRHRRWGLAMLLFAGGAAAVLTLTPQAGMNALKRWLMPLSDTARFTFTRLENPPTTMAVPYGEAFDVTLRLARGSDFPATGSTGCSRRWVPRWWIPSTGFLSPANKSRERSSFASVMRVITCGWNLCNGRSCRRWRRLLTRPPT
jgi:hypothetical protein